MDKSKQKALLLAVLAVIIAAVLGVSGWVTAKVLTRPGPRQEKLARLKAEQKAMTPKQKEIEQLKIHYETKLKEVEELPPFEPPQDGLITPEQMRRYAEILSTTVKTIEEEKAKIPNGRKSLAEGIMYSNIIAFTVQGTQAMKMLDHMMSNSEYEWIQAKVQDAEIIALLRLEKLTQDPEARKKIRGLAVYMSTTAGYSVHDEKGESIGKPEMLNPSTVPELHVKYFLQYRNQLKIPYVPIDELDWTPLLKQEGMPTE